MARRKVIITVAQTGAFHGKEANPNIPLTPEEIAASAYDCYNAGAAIIHIHARDQEGLSTNDPKVYSAIGSGIRARGNAILQYSTAPANREGTCAEDGMRLLYDPDLVKPEMCSLDCSLIGTSWGDRTFVYEWYRPFLLKYARKMRDMGIKPELECFNPESVEDVFNVLVPAGVLEEPVSLSFVMGMDRISQGSISFSEENLDFMIKKLPKDRFVNFSTISIGAKHQGRRGPGGYGRQHLLRPRRAAQEQRPNGGAGRAHHPRAGHGGRHPRRGPRNSEARPVSPI